MTTRPFTKSKPLMVRGKQITTIDDVLKETVVWVEAWKRPAPVAFLQNFTVHTLQHFIQSKSIFTAIRPKS
jgi:hypothetical protein